MRIRTLFVALALLAGACTSSPAPGVSPTTPPPPASPESPSPVPTGPGSAAAALAKLCVRPPTSGPGGAKKEGPTPPAVAEVEREVEQVRGLEFTEPVVADPVTHAELVKRLMSSFDHSFPTKLYARRSLAWRTIGAIPPGTSIRRSLLKFAGGQVIGFYDPTSGELVFIGTEDPSPIERITLAHELTHAIDDQNFGLERLDAMEKKCQDEAEAAAVGAVEGSAQFFSLQVAQRFLSPEEQLSLLGQKAPSLSGIPPFIVQSELWSYTAGMRFVLALYTKGGIDAVNAAIRDLPVSTEQIIHPERYPNDVPQPVDVPDLGPKLGAGWSDLDVMQVGEEWLSILLGLRIDRATADTAAAGWDGGLYRGWSKGDHVAVVLSTVWDSSGDAIQFGEALGQWMNADPNRQMYVQTAGTRLTVLFASDPGTLAALRAAL